MAPKNATRLWCYNLVKKRWFDIFITTCIFLNTVVMASKYYTMSKNMENVLEYLNYVFAAIFNIECILKLIG